MTWCLKLNTKKRICIIHHSLNSCGGGEFLSLSLAKALKEIKYKVIYYTIQKTDWELVKNAFNTDFKPDEEFNILKIKLPYFGIYQRLFAGIMMKPKRKCDLVINTHGDVMPFVDSDIIYMHYPTFSLWYENPVNVKYLRSFFWKSYFLPYYGIQRTLVRKIKGIIITNSKFSRKAIERYVGRKALIVYPPVPVEHYDKLLHNIYDRKNIVVTIGRFTYEKRYEEVLRIAKKVPYAKFVIIGAVSNNLNYLYFKKITKLINEYKIKNVILLPNLSFAEKIKILSKAKVDLHTMINEHFGIAIVEAMASGLVPVIHRSGGPWEDILQEKQGVYGFAFRKPEEAANYISYILANDKLRFEIIKRNKANIRRFTTKVFANKMLRIVNMALEYLGSK